MATLTVSKFSCIDKAMLELSPMTVLIGPQASGKSVLSKLLYFFIQVSNSLVAWAIEQRSLSAVTEQVETDFARWFPSSAWGSQPFRCEFTLGTTTMSIKRRRAVHGKSDRVSFTMSDYWTSQYEWMIAAVEAATSQKNRERSTERFNIDFEIDSRVRGTRRDELIANFGDEFVQSQLFVPAGRSFFTTMGKAVAAFQMSGLLDPVTLTFGNLFAALRDRGNRVHFIGDAETMAARRALGVDLFGGELRFGRDDDHVITTDGRRVPFSALSSGQQELLPLWLAIESFAAQPIPTSRRKSGRARYLSRLAYIEEPEAHLFPSAQGQLLEFLVGTINLPVLPRRMLITTHSPYILSKINSLAMAGRLGSKKQLSDAVQKIVDQNLWIKPGALRSYAIIERRLTDILDEDGLIDGEYLDSVSSDISKDFSALLDLA